MENEILVISLTLFVGMIEIILGFPLLYEKVKPNSLYGFRTPKTLSDKELWYKANKYAGRDLIIAGIIVIISTLILLSLISGLTDRDIVGFLLLITLAPIVIVLIRGFLYLKKLEE